MAWEQYVHKLNEEKEIETKVMYSDVTFLLKRHERGLEILEAIHDFERRKELQIDSINGFAGTFPELRKKYVNRVDTINRCINKLHKKYKSIMK